MGVMLQIAGPDVNLTSGKRVHISQQAKILGHALLINFLPVNVNIINIKYYFIYRLIILNLIIKK